MLEQSIINKLKGHIPDNVLEQIPVTAVKFNITNKLRLAHFISQCSHESANFTAVRENLNYSGIALKKIFPKYFPGVLNLKYSRNPEKIANRVYANRMGNGNELSGDGYKYRGRGYIQLTGKFNYIAFDQFVEDKITENPDLVAIKYPLMSAGFFFFKNGLWSTCDQGSTEEIITLVTKRINGGIIGLDDRILKFKTIYKILSD